MPILIKNESFNNIFLWKLCFIENNYFLCIVKLKKRRIMKYVIIGGVAGGATAAARLRRDRKSTRLNSSHMPKSRMPSSA